MTIDGFLSRLASLSDSSAEHPFLPPVFTIADAGPFPLKQHIKPDGHTLDGELLLSFDSLSVAPVILGAVQSGSDKRHFSVTLEPASLRGKYQLYYNECAQVTLDTGGFMAPLPAEGEETGEMTEEKYWRLVQLEKERAQLNQSANGRVLVNEYNEHNDVYHQVFTENEQLRKFWHQDGASDEMGEHTSEALKSGAVINPPDGQFGAKGVSYNSNAFAQQLNLWAACLTNHKEAAEAALKFSDTVDLTGNTQTVTVPLTGEQVHASVYAEGRAVNPAESSAKVQALHTALCNIVVNKVATDSDIQVCHGQGYVMDLETQQRLQEIYQASLRAQDPMQRVALSSECFEIALPQSEFNYLLTAQPDGALTLKLLATTLRIPQIPLGPEVGEPVSTRFIRGLLVDRIASGLTRCLREMARQES